MWFWLFCALGLGVGIFLGILFKPLSCPDDRDGESE